MSEKFVGKWNLLESENFDAYLKHIGIGIIQRKLATSIKPSLLIDVNESHWKMTSVSTFKTHSIEFDLGVEFTEETIDGRKMKASHFYFHFGRCKVYRFVIDCYLYMRDRELLKMNKD